MIMILTLLPAESDAAKKLADLTSENSVLAAAVGKITDFTGTEEEEGEDVNVEEERGEQDAEQEKEEKESAVDIVLTDYNGEEADVRAGGTGEGSRCRNGQCSLGDDTDECE